MLIFRDVILHIHALKALRGLKMVQRLKGLATKHDDLSLIPRTHPGGRKQVLQFVLWSYTHKHTQQMHKYAKWIYI